MSLDRIGSCFKCSLDGLYKKDHSDGEREVRQRERGWRKEGKKGGQDELKEELEPLGGILRAVINTDTHTQHTLSWPISLSSILSSQE